MNLRSETCTNCGEYWVPEKDIDGTYTFETTVCAYCEQTLCSHCFPRHVCSGHKAEIIDCTYCDEPIDGTPIILKGDPFCESCGTKKPWEEKEMKS